MFTEMMMSAGSGGGTLEKSEEYTFKISAAKTHDTGIPVEDSIFIVCKSSENSGSFILRDENGNTLESIIGTYLRIDISGNTIVITDDYASVWYGTSVTVKVYKYS